jgi:hypothetical protein
VADGNEGMAPPKAILGNPLAAVAVVVTEVGAAAPTLPAAGGVAVVTGAGAEAGVMLVVANVLLGFSNKDIITLAAINCEGEKT